MKKATGVVRKTDDLGRIVLPKELRRTLDIQDVDPLEIFIDGDQIILQKYNPGCMICGALEGEIIAYKGKLLCGNCLDEARKALGR